LVALWGLFSLKKVLVGPLKMADDAVLLETDGKTIEDQVLKLLFDWFLFLNASFVAGGRGDEARAGTRCCPSRKEKEELMKKGEKCFIAVLVCCSCCCRVLLSLRPPSPQRQ
jgi:hypothetical protein